MKKQLVILGIVCTCMLLQNIQRVEAQVYVQEDSVIVRQMQDLMRKVLELGREDTKLGADMLTLISQIRISDTQEIIEICDGELLILEKKQNEILVSLTKISKDLRRLEKQLIVLDTPIGNNFLETLGVNTLKTLTANVKKAGKKIKKGRELTRSGCEKVKNGQ
jgi:hypothetical protein